MKYLHSWPYFDFIQKASVFSIDKIGAGAKQLITNTCVIGTNISPAPNILQSPLSTGASGDTCTGKHIFCVGVHFNYFRRSCYFGLRGDNLSTCLQVSKL